MSNHFVDKIKSKNRLKKNFTDNKYINTIYSEYSQWARHYHLLVWTTFAFGISIALYATTYYFKLNAPAFTILGTFIISFLLITRYIAKANRLQWSECKEVANWIEVFLQARDEKYLNRPLVEEVEIAKKKSKRARVEKGRELLFYWIVILWIVLIILRWSG